MPSSNGVYSLPSGYLAVTGATIQASQHNPPLEDIATALTGRLSRDGTAAMTGALQLAVGAVGLPGVVFSTDPTTGLYKTANGIGVAIGGAKVAEFLAGGITGARVLGELVAYTGRGTVPSLFVLPYGQTLSRTTYADLWAFAQVEIAAGNVFFNNGDGSTTFGIGDLRGRVIAGKDDMGGSGAFRLTTAIFGTSPQVLGAAGGTETKTLLTANLPPYTPSGTVIVTSNGGPQIVYMNIATSNNVGYGGTATGASVTTPTFSGSFNGSAQGGTSTPFSITQPTMVCNYILFAGA